MQCPYCSNEYSKFNIKQHIKKHENPEEYKKYIDRLTINGINSGKKTGRKNAIASIDKRREKLKIHATSNTNFGKASTEYTEKIRIDKIKAKSVNNGGYRKGSGHGKSGWYKGIWCDSSWELAFVIYQLDHNNQIKRCLEARNYTYLSKIRKYIPDFIVNNQEIVEIKGYKSQQWLAKISHNQDIKVFYEIDLIEILNYVIDKYGKDYIKLYDKEVCEQGAQEVSKTLPAVKG